MGLLIPTDDKELEDSKIWYVLYGGIPISFFLVYGLGLIFVMKYESVQFLIVQDKYKGDKSQYALRQVYKQCKSWEDSENYKVKLLSICDKESSNIGLCTALTNPIYRKASWVNVGQMLFHEFVGINVIIQYSNQIFIDMQDSGSSITPKKGTFIIGIVHLFATSMSVLGIKKLPRKTLLFLGFVGISIAHGGVGWFNNQGNSDAVLGMMLLFIFVYMNTSGPVAWVYAAETLVDSSLGCSLFTLWSSIFVLSLISPILMS